MADQELNETLLTHGSTSPFLPDTFIQFAWDSTCLGLIKSCPRLYQYTMIDGYVGKGESIHLECSHSSVHVWVYLGVSSKR